MIEIEMRVVRLITFLYGVCKVIVIIVKMGTIVIINRDIKDKLVIIVPLGIIVILNTPRRSYRDYNRDVENEKLVKINRSKRDDRGGRKGLGR